MDEPAVKVEHVSKTFRLPHEKITSIKSAVINFYRHKRTYEIQKVISDMSFEVQKGDFFGIVGRNGSGKSTLLKMMAGTYTPSAGHIQVNGKLTPFIELGVGFNPELTGRENVYLNGALLGFSRKEMAAMYGDIVSFAELERFMDQKLRNYSSGMQVRLAFSIAIRAQSDVLLLDEVLAVGDEAFQRKCYDYFKDLKRNKKTVIIVTHDMAAVEKFCNKGILIEDGHIRTQGDARAVAQAYKELFDPEYKAMKAAKAAKAAEPEEVAKKRWGDQRLTFTDIKVDKITDERVHIDFGVLCNKPVSHLARVAFTVKSSDENSLFGETIEIPYLQNLKVGQEVRLKLSFMNLLSRGEYLMDFSIRIPHDDKYCEFWADCLEFKIDRKIDNGLHILVNSKLEKA